MVDVFTSIKRSLIMASIRSKGNRTTEIRFIRLMRKMGIKGWRRGSKLLGRPDFVFSAERVAVFIDGDFWHGNPRKFRLPKSNLAYWGKKIASNRTRDRLVSRTLRSQGWTVVRFWESSLRDGEVVMADLKFALLKTRRQVRPSRSASL
jgi:DNA mismatch endonuclease (patch repair protein)